MRNAVLADQQIQFNDKTDGITRATVLKVFAVIIVVSFILRIFYAGHLYEDDGLWFTAGEEILRGKALYREIYFDKPPGLALVYALLFWIFGAHIITVRLFTIAYSVAISVVLYLFGSWLYDKRVGLWAAALFAVFSTTYATGHVHGLGTDLVMALPYTGAAYLLVRSRGDLCAGADKTHSVWPALAGGVLVGIAFQINPKGIFDLIFFTVFLIASHRWSRQIDKAKAELKSAMVSDVAGARWGGQSAVRLFALAVSGFVIGSLPFLVYIAATRSLRTYRSYVWDWGARYGSYYGTGKVLLAGLTRSADYFTLNNTLTVALIFLVAITVRRGVNSAANAPSDADHTARASFTEGTSFEHDATLLMWFGVSYLGVTVGGRFFAHYFIQILPSLCLVGARGLTGIFASLRAGSLPFRRAGITIIAIGFAFTLVRFHGRSMRLAADFLRGKVSESNVEWYYSVRNREERMVAAVVRDLPDGAADQMGLEAIRAGGPRTRAAEGPLDYVFVWGYRPEIYYWSGLLPASRYLSTQPLTGVPADVHYFGDDYRSILEEPVTAEARAELARDLEETQPKYIVDEIGFYNGDLAILKYPELEKVMSEYKAIGSTGRFLMYVRRELRKQYLLRNQPKQP
jgi:4-amino-4-deoxy-L-arabinose transferase-like glycosyltransferase